jgi:hypothetical protein
MRPRTVILVISLISLVVVCAIAGVAGYFYVSSLAQYDIYGPDGYHGIEKVVLTNELDEDENPVESQKVFRPSDPIIGWVGTKGAEGIIGFRWFYEDEMIFEYFGKTTDNKINTYIQSNNTVILPEGNYRLEIHTTGVIPREVLEFTVEQYKPEVEPAQPSPVAHQKLERSVFVEVPFAFDETWAIGGEAWQINEVKIVFLGDEAVCPAIVVETDLDLEKLSDEQAHELTKPIAIYAIENGYIETAREIKVDGISYDFDQVYVNMIKDINNITTGSRVKFLIKDLE